MTADWVEGRVVYVYVLRTQEMAAYCDECFDVVEAQKLRKLG